MFDKKPSNSVEQQVFNDRVKLLFMQYHIGFISALSVALVTLVVLWNVVNNKLLVTWFVVVTILLLIRAGIVVSSISPKASTTDEAWYRRYILFLATAFLLGATWGLLGTILYPEGDDAYKTFVIVILAGMSSGALPLMFPIKNVFVAFVTPILLPFFVHMLILGDPIYIAIALLTLFYLSGMLLISIRGERGITEKIRLRYENIDLINELKQTKNHLTTAKNSLEDRVKERTAELLTTNKILNDEIHERQKVENKLFEQKEFAETTLTSITDGIITTDAKGYVSYINTAAESLTGYRTNEVIGKHCRECLNLINNDETLNIDDQITQVVDGKHSLTSSNHWLLIDRQGGSVAVKKSFAPIFTQDGRVNGIVIILHNVNNERLYQLQLSHIARHDALTGLYNRLAFEECLKQLLAKHQNSKKLHALLYIDLDDFKVLNDTCGHAAGDELLRQLSSIMPSHVKANDLFARLGGDEFGVIVEDCSVEQVESLAEAILNNIREFRFVWQNKYITIGASIGVYTFKSGSQTITNIMSAADIACFAAKDLGRNRIHVYSREDEDLASRREELDWVSQIRDAIEGDRLELFKQTIIQSKTKNMTERAELLLRVIDSDGNYISPGSFISAAERFHMMPQIDRWVITRVHEHYKNGDLGKNNSTTLISINLSGASLTDENLTQYIYETIQDKIIPADCICFEITETAAISNMDAAVKFMNRMRSLGCKFSIDDFGSGVSSFGYLKALPVDYVKIDGSFVRDMTSDPVNRAMVESIHNIVKIYEKETIAEYVESDEISEMLISIGVDYLQGYAISKPEALN